MTDFFNDYGEELPPGASREAYDSVVINNLVDFGRLDEPLQEELISAILESKDAKESIRAQSSIESLSTDRIERNARAVQENFSIVVVGKTC